MVLFNVGWLVFFALGLNDTALVLLPWFTLIWMCSFLGKFVLLVVWCYLCLLGFAWALDWFADGFGCLI